jgi:hypothetical protein
MDLMRISRLTFPAALALAALLATPSNAAATSKAPPPRNDVAMRVHFTKHIVDSQAFRFAGTASGAANGTLVSQIIRETAPETDRFRFVMFRWTITAPTHSFVAETQGTLDKTTGEVVMAGSVVSGWRVGGAVLGYGHLTDPSTFTYEGDVVLLDSTP